MEFGKMNGGYVSPEMEVIGLQLNAVIAVSGEENVTVNDPWVGNTEIEW